MWRVSVAAGGELVADEDDEGRGEDAAEDGGDGTFPGFAGAEAGGELVFAEGAADVEGGDISGPDADHEEDDEGDAVLLLPEERDEGEGVGDVDEAEDAFGGAGEYAVEVSGLARKPFQAKRMMARALRTGNWASRGQLGRVTRKARVVPAAIHQRGCGALRRGDSAPVLASWRYS